MKKILIVTLAALLIFSLAACSAPPAQETLPSPSAEGEASSQPSDNASASPADGQQTPPEGANVQMEQILGKVKSIVGNELTLDLANLPAGAAGMENGEGSEGGDVAMAQAPSVSITTEESKDVGGSQSADGESGRGEELKIGGAEGGGTIVADPALDNMPKLELEYTGETKDITIPAGLKILDMFGKELKMADLKEGNVLMVMTREDGSIDSIIVME